MSMKSMQSDNPTTTAREFENLLSEVSAKCINLPFNEIEATAREDFKLLSRLLGVDRCKLIVFDRDKQDRTNTSTAYSEFEWASDGTEFFAGSHTESALQTPDLVERMEPLFNIWRRGEIHEVTESDLLSGRAEAADTFLSS